MSENQMFSEQEVVNMCFGAEGLPNPTLGKTTRYDVVIKPEEGLLPELVEKYVIEFNRIAKAKLRYDQDYISTELFQKYVNTLIKIRILTAREEKLHDLSPTRANTKVPVFLSYCLRQIGIAKDRQFGLLLAPAMCDSLKNAGNVLDAIGMQKVSDLLSELEDLGVKMVSGIARETTGSIGYMSTTIMEQMISGEATEFVCSHRMEHAVYGFLGAIIKAQQTHNVFSQFNVLYDPIEDYRLGLSLAVRGSGRS